MDKSCLDKCLVSVWDAPRSLHLKFYKNWVSNSGAIASIEFLWVDGVAGWWVGVVCKVIFMSNPTKVILDWGWVELWLSWGFDNIRTNNNNKKKNNNNKNIKTTITIKDKYIKNEAFVRLGSCDNVQTERWIFEYATGQGFKWRELIRPTDPSSWSVQLICQVAKSYQKLPKFDICCQKLP